MVVGCWNENGKWRIEEKVASLIVGLRTLFQDKKEKFGIEYACYVILYADPLSPYYDFEEDDRKKHVAHSIWGNGVPVKLLKDRWVLDAIEEYERLSATTPVKMMRTIEKIMKQANDHLNSITITDANIKEVVELSNKLPGYYDNYKAVRDKVKIEEGNLISKIKGDGTLSWAEQQVIGKTG